MEGIQDSVPLSMSQGSNKSHGLLSLINSHYNIMISTTKTRNDRMEIQALAFSYHDFPTSDAITETKAEPKILTTSQPQGSMFTRSAEPSILMIPELRLQHEKQPREINEMLQIKH